MDTARKLKAALGRDPAWSQAAAPSVRISVELSTSSCWLSKLPPTTRNTCSMLALGALLSTVFSDPLVVGVYEGATRVALSGGVEAGQVRLPAQLGVEGGLARGPVQYSTV